MPRRKYPLVNDQIYHVYNCGANKQPIFFVNGNYIRAIKTIEYYLVHKPSLSFSRFLQLSLEGKVKMQEAIVSMQRAVEFISYSLMPNHYHFLLKQVVDDGIKDFVRNFQISYTRYANIKHDRTGPLLQGQFKALLIEDSNQLNHVVRYIHLNSYTSYIVKNLKELKDYPWSSLPEYLGIVNKGFCSKKIILSQYKDVDKYWEFVANQAGYQRGLKKIKHLVHE